MPYRPTKTVLLTGFEPFGGDRVNPSSLAVRALDGRTIAHHRVVAAELPCVFGGALVALRRELRRHKPAVTVCVGLAGGRAAIGVERVAINVDDARIADNRGAKPVDRAIVHRGPVGYFATLPIKAIVAALRKAGVPAEVSQTAGTFVCNHVFYGLMHALEIVPGARGGFVHVPYLPEQVARAGGGAPSMPLETIVRALEVVVATALARKRDVRAAGGAEH